MIEIINKGSEDVLALRASGVLTHEDYESFIPLLDVEVREKSHVSVFIDIIDFKGMTPHAILDDFMTGMKYWFNFKKIAVLGDNKWENYIVKIVSAIMPCEIKFFDAKEEDKAWEWLES